MNTFEIRQANLIALVGDPSVRGAIRQFADKHNLNPDQIRQLVNGGRKIGEKLARRLESEIGLTSGSLDRPISNEVMERAAEYTAKSYGQEAVEILHALRNLPPEKRATALRLIQAL